MTEQVPTADLLIVGGGINGAAIARDAAGRGLSVLLCERDDIASHTSSASTKLIHGGLRYLEQFEFALVGKALAERKRLLRMAPHIIWPLRFVLPHQPHLRPAWMIRIGLFLYDRLGGRRGRGLPGSRSVNLRKHIAGRPLQDDFVRGFVYSDAWVQDARLCVLNAMDASERGATVLTRTACVSATRGEHDWQVQLRGADGAPRTVRARALVNATGPWAARFLDEVAHVPHNHTLRLIKGSHIVVPKLFDHDHAYIFQQPDRRIVFAIPYEHDYTLIGTTDVDYREDPSSPRIDQAETQYLCEAASRYFKRPIRPDDVVWTYSGVRPLLDDDSDQASEITRDYLLTLDRQGAPLLNVFGGKLTTSRKLAEEACDTLSPLFGAPRPAWTGGAPLPGGDLPDANFEAFHEDFSLRRPWLPDALALRLCRNYGSRALRIVESCSHLEELGERFGSDLYAAEVDYLIDFEWARTAEDILWRRSKLGLRIDAQGQRRLQEYVAMRLGGADGEV
ncbi:glycerol-3-phosphate dehydrogenase [Lysobacter gummosus]|uniref:Glycerol-3-phosphate dehydrogenase n=1 Tax=Lysobacter gummosus TaxID=262324 RepID=A0ABY3XFP1_9GAMM|nr:glycerol-3-phosphate dehydrogenase [Lysobacter gummosus]ALN89847.1 FAD binding domain protein [Lysobacter gummosus]UNP30445.1 glycerol-3-phosphate dehydrogenase [Lysobacter gummosus]